MARAILGLSILGMTCVRPTIRSPEPEEPLFVELEAGRAISPRLVRRLLQEPPPQPGSHILAVHWTGQAFDVEVQLDGPRTLALVDHHGRTRTQRVQGSGRYLLAPVEGPLYPPFTILALSSRGAGLVSDSEALLVNAVGR